MATSTGPIRTASTVHTQQIQWSLVCVQRSASIRNGKIQILHCFTPYAWIKWSASQAGEKITKFQYQHERQIILAFRVHCTLYTSRKAYTTFVCGKIHYHNNMKYASQKNLNVFKICVGSVFGCVAWCVRCACAVCCVRYVYAYARLFSHLVMHILRCLMCLCVASIYLLH